MQNVIWLLEDVPLITYLPMLGAVSMLHLVNHIYFTPALWHAPVHFGAVAFAYMGLGEQGGRGARLYECA